MKAGWVVIAVCVAVLVALGVVVHWPTTPLPDVPAVQPVADRGHTGRAARPDVPAAPAGNQAGGASRLPELLHNTRSAPGAESAPANDAPDTVPDDDGVRARVPDTAALPNGRRAGSLQAAPPGDEPAPGQPSEPGTGQPSEPAAGQPSEPEADVVFDGGVERTFGTENRVEIPDAGRIRGEAGTISFWLSPQWAGDDQRDAVFVQLGDGGLRLAKNVDFLRFEYLDSSGAEQGLGISIGEWNAGDWHQVTGTWGDGTWALYVDGRLASRQQYSEPPRFATDARLYVGSDFPEQVPVAPGDVSRLTVLNRVTSADEVAQQFQTGAPHHD